VKPSLRGKLLEDGGEKGKRKVSVLDLDTANFWNIIQNFIVKIFNKESIKKLIFIK